MGEDFDIVLCGSLLPLSLEMDWGPTNDKCQAKSLIAKAQQVAMPDRLYADAAMIPKRSTRNAGRNGEPKA